MKKAVCGILVLTGLACGAAAQQERKHALGDGDAFEGKPYPACLDASQYGHAALMSRYNGDAPLSDLIEANHRRHDPEVAAVMDRIALRAYRVPLVATKDAGRVAAVFRDTLYMVCVQQLQAAPR